MVAYVQPDVSIIVPCHNVAGDVHRTLSSISRQSHPSFEAVLVDDGSVDGTCEILKQYSWSDPRFRVVVQPNRRLAAARNTGLATARSQRVMFLDAGDELEPDAVTTLGGLLDMDPDAGAAFGGFRLVGPDAPRQEWISMPPALRLSFSDFTEVNPLNANSVMLQRPWLLQTGLFDSSLPACEDWDLWARLARCGCRFVGTDHPVSRYRMQAGSHSRRVELMFDGGCAVIRQLHAVDERCLLRDRTWQRGAPASKLPEALAHWCTYCLAVAYASGGTVAAEALLDMWPVSAAAPEPRLLARHLHAAWPYVHCRFPEEWPEFWNHHAEDLRAWWASLQSRLGEPGFALECQAHLLELIQEGEVLERVLSAVAERRESLSRIVVYGYGKNGRRLVERLSQDAALEVAIADDGDVARPIHPYLRPADDQLIIVTPWRHRMMSDRLLRAGAEAGRHFIVWSDFASVPEFAGV